MLQNHEIMMEAITEAIDDLPGYNDPDWKTMPDNLRCDIDFVLHRLKSRLIQIEHYPCTSLEEMAAEVTGHTVDLEAMMAEKLDELDKLHPFHQASRWKITMNQIEAIRYTREVANISNLTI